MIAVRKGSTSGIPGIWVCAAAVTFCVALLLGLLFLIVTKGLEHFWAKPVASFSTADGGNAIGAMIRTERSADGTIKHLFKIANRDVNRLDFRWYEDAMITGELSYPPELAVVERYEWGDAYGIPIALHYTEGGTVAGGSLWPALEQVLADADLVRERLRELSRGEVTAVNMELQELRLESRRRELAGQASPYTDLDNRKENIMQRNDNLSKAMGELRQQLQSAVLLLRLADGSELKVSIDNIARVYRPNAMNFIQQVWFFIQSFASFLSDEPREANSEGGVYPAIFGTVLLVLVMSILVMPLGVIAAVYLHEYARPGVLIKLVRISVNNLAGVPSIVYGVFGLGFFVYFIGAKMDTIFYPESLPTPVFGTPGLLWSSLTLALLTVPVVVVATEEGLSRVPKSIREGSLALGATRAETLWKMVLPISLPAILTGQILAVSRAAGEVAPLMLVGVVKHAPDLPIDGHFPFVHLERKFMHLGFHIYDVGFQSPNVEAARPLVYATALLLIFIVLVLNISATWLRSYLRKRYNVHENV